MSPAKRKKKTEEEREKPLPFPTNHEGGSALVRHPHLQFVIIGAAILCWLTFYSFTSSDITWGEFSLKKPEIRETLVRDASADTVKALRKLLAWYDAGYVRPVRTLDTTKQRVLLFGDSELEGFMPALSDYCIENGHQLNSVVWYSSTTKSWGNCDTLTHFIKEFKPTYVIACLGLNEVLIPNVKDRQQSIRHIMEQCAGLKFIYVGPAAWREDMGIDKLLMSTVGRGRYYQSKKLVLDRARDGAHPTRMAARIWMDKVAEWIVNESKYPIRLNKPNERHKVPPMVILRPAV
jgi:hypothetical protein